MNYLSRCKPALGTYVEISIGADVDDDALIAMSNQAFEMIAHVEQLMSFHNLQSELSHVNRQAYKTACVISPELKFVLENALQLSELSQGAFDVSVAGELVKQGALPDHGLSFDPQSSWQDIHLEGDTLRFGRRLLIDLGGIAKGYAVDKALALFGEEVEVNVCAGGDIAVSHWQNQTASVRHPSQPNKVIALPMENRALATSAYYYLDDKPGIISPLDKRPVDENFSVSVFADTCLIADALTKIVFLCSDIEPILTTFEASAVTVTADGQLLTIKESV